MSTNDAETDFEAQLDALSQLETFKHKRKEILGLRESNAAAAVVVTRRQHEVSKGKSDFKKSTAYVKKIKAINTEGLKQCISDSDTLNLTLYISEIVNGIVETSFKATDVPDMVKLCISLHRRYEEFTSALLPALRASLLSIPSEDDKDAGKRKRIQIRFVIELFQAGIWAADDFFCDLLKFILGKSKTGTQQQPMDLLSLGTFVKYGSEILLGYVPKRIQSLARVAAQPLDEIPITLIANARASAEMKQLVNDTFTKLCEELVKSHKDLRSKEKKMEKDRLMHGTVSEQKQAEYDAIKRRFEKLNTTAVSLAESIGEELPILEDEKEEEDNGRGITVWDGTAGTADFGPHGDAESRAFYEDLPDLLGLVPLSALGLTPEQATAMREEWKAAKDRGYRPGAEEEAAFLAEVDSTAKISTADTLGAASPVTPGVEVATEGRGEEEDTPATLQAAVGSAAVGSAAASPVAPTEVDEGAAAGKGGEDGAELKLEPAAVEDTPQARVLSLLQDKLPECVNKRLADEFSEKFCYVNGKGARKKLITALVRVPRSRSELTCTYARITVTLSRVLPDIGVQVLDALMRDFHGQLRGNRTLQYIDNRVKTVRLIGELIKFGLAPPITAFRMFNSLLGDFTCHNVDLFAILLETCGRYLYLLSYTHERMAQVLETMLRLRRAKFLDLRQQALLEMAYFAVKPPDRVVKEKKVLTQMQQYICYLLLERLDSPGANVDDVIDCMRRLPWTSPEEGVEDYVVKTVMKVARSKYVSIPGLADCLSGLNRSYPSLLVRVVDRCLEEIQRGFDAPHKRVTQRLLGIARLMGEFYNFQVVSSAVIFEMLYHCINFGHLVPAVGTAAATPVVVDPATGLAVPITYIGKYDPRVPCDLDPPGDLFRAQLVCELLNTCGNYYVRGSSRDKLARFLTYFQRFLLTKPALPIHVEFAILDTFEDLEESAREAINEKIKSAKNKASGLSAELQLLLEKPVFPRFDSMESVLVAVEALEIKPETDGAEEEEEEEEEAPEVDVGEGVEAEDEDDDFMGLNEEEEEFESNLRAAQRLESLRAAEAADEDEEFEKAFKSMMQESVTSIKSAAQAKSDMQKMAIPAVLPKAKNIDYRGGDDDDDDAAVPNKGGMAFKLLSRNTKGKVEVRQLLVPEEASMSVNLIKTEAAMRREKQILREKVLSLQEQQAGEDYSNAEYLGVGRDAYDPSPRGSSEAGGSGAVDGGPSSSYRHSGERGRGGGGGGGGHGGGGGRFGRDGPYGATGPQGMGVGAVAGGRGGGQSVSGPSAAIGGGGGSSPTIAPSSMSFGKQTYVVRQDTGASSVYVAGQGTYGGDYGKVGFGGGRGRGRWSKGAIRAEETRRPADSLNLDEFLAETHKSEIRRMGGR